ncbi:MAG TPA: YicC/YloC family endoribonuclease [Bacillales bacterium]|nr:YicC/YloC family endoribonuclease [Bacillales bacterium]
MIKSMTGYGRKSVQTDAYSVLVEMKSVNHRFLECSIQLPRPILPCEDRIKKLVTKRLERGKINVYISVEGKELSKRTLNVDWQLLDQYVNELNAASQRYSLAETLAASDLLKIEGVFDVSETDEQSDEVTDKLLEATEGALDQLLEMRRNEGRFLYDDLEQRLALMEETIVQLKAYAPSVAEGYRKRLAERMKAYLQQNAEIDEAKLLNEVAVYSEKANIDEELTRLMSHVKQFHKYLRSEEAVGKKLNFLQQEMNREINTIGAKANDFDISVHVVELKSELEKIREQIQNIE